MNSIRRDCAFCGRERSARDDNHAPTCSYWAFFPDADPNAATLAPHMAQLERVLTDKVALDEDGAA